MKLGLVDVGGGLRGIYSSGILDYCLDNKISFDLCIGVSAGSANIITYLAGQRGRNYKFYTEYSKRSEYMSIKNYIKTGSYINMDYVYQTLSGSNGEFPLNYDAYEANKAEFLVVATNARTGNAKYFTRADIKRDNYGALAASCSIPGVNEPFEVDNEIYFDGGLSDPVPILKAFSEGCDKVVLLLTKPVREDLKQSPLEQAISLFIKKDYKEASERLMNRIDTYNRSINIAKEYAKEGRLLILAPESIDGVSTLIRKGNSLDSLYRLGMKDAEKLKGFINN